MPARDHEPWNPVPGPEGRASAVEPAWRKELSRYSVSPSATMATPVSIHRSNSFAINMLAPRLPRVGRSAEPHPPRLDRAVGISITTASAESAPDAAHHRYQIIPLQPAAAPSLTPALP